MALSGRWGGWIGEAGGELVMVEGREKLAVARAMVPTNRGDLRAACCHSSDSTAQERAQRKPRVNPA